MGSLTVGTIAEYSCNSSYLLVGQSQRTCMEDQQRSATGVWSGDPPLCLGEFYFQEPLLDFLDLPLAYACCMVFCKS